MQEFARPIHESNYIGFNDKDPSELLGPGVFTKVDNAFVSDRKISKVTGSSTVASAIASQTINGLTSYEKISASVKYIIVNIDGASNAQLYRWSGSGNFSAIGSANLTNAKTMIFETANDYNFGFNGTEVVDYDGTTVTKNRAGVPIGFYPKWFHNYLFVSNNSSFPNRLYWSNLGDPTTFSGANYVDINPGDSDQSMGLGTLQDELFVFKKNTIWSITGWSGATFSATTIAAQNTNVRIIGYGCVAPESIVSAGNDIYFMSFLGGSPVIRSLKKTINAITLGGGVISNDIKATMDTINTSNISKTSASFDGRYIYFSFPTGSSTVNNKIVAMDTWQISYSTRLRRNIYAWSTLTGKNASRFVISTISGKAIPYFADSGATGLVLKFDSSLYSDNGAAVVMDVRSRDFMSDPSRKTKWKYMYLKYKTGSAGSLLVKARGDQATDFATQATISLAGSSPGLGPTGTFTLGTSTLGGQLTSKKRVTFQHITSTMLGLQFLESTANSCDIYEYEIYGKLKGFRDD